MGSGGFLLFIRNANNAYFLLEEMTSYNYHWYLSQYNVQKYKNTLEYIEKMLDKQGEIVREIHLQTISMIEHVLEQVCEDIFLDEEPMEQ